MQSSMVLRAIKKRERQCGVVRIGAAGLVIHVIVIILCINPLEGRSTRSLYISQGLSKPYVFSEKRNAVLDSTGSTTGVASVRFAGAAGNSTKRLLFGLRGGGNNPVLSVFGQFTKAIAESTTISWILLIAVIVNETAATTLSKMASENDSPLYLALSMLLFNVRCVLSFR
jgi:hypothetical protein